jgi:acetyl-CoA carboxylase biotin carboxyl carrier protein
MPDSRLFAPELVALVARTADGHVHVQAPAPGLYRGAPERGELVRPGMIIGELEQLGVLHRVRAPEQAQGVVIASPSSRARTPVARGVLLLALDPEALVGAAGQASTTETATDSGALVFRAPSAGRFFVRPAPDKPAFVEVGQLVTRGQTLGLIEVMKTFTRVHYDDPRLPERARVTAIAVRDQDEIEAGTVLLQLEAE